MSGRNKRFTEDDFDELVPLGSPNIYHGEVYWLSSGSPRRIFAPSPVRASRVLDAARRAAAFTGERVLVWWQDVTGEMVSEVVWAEWPGERGKPTGRSLAHFSYIP